MHTPVCVQGIVLLPEPFPTDSKRSRQAEGDRLGSCSSSNLGDPPGAQNVGQEVSDQGEEMKAGEGHSLSHHWVGFTLESAKMAKG